jgi:hypothetical protein
VLGQGDIKMFEIEKINISCDLSITSLEELEEQYFVKYGIPATTLLVAPENIFHAYQIISKRNDLRLMIVPIPGIERNVWMVGGFNGLFYSPGAL